MRGACEASAMEVMATIWTLVILGFTGERNFTTETFSLGVSLFKVVGNDITYQNVELAYVH